MKKVEFMKLNLQQENILSKEERKEVLGGYTCYVRCGSSVIVTGANSCAELQHICGPYDKPSCCVCNGSC